MSDHLGAFVLIIVALLLCGPFLAFCLGLFMGAIRARLRDTGHQLRAAGTTLAFTPDVVAGVAADVASRTITGLIIPWEEYGDTSVGRVIAGRGSIRLPADPSRVKLVDHHQDPPRAIGYGTAFTDTPAGIQGSFHVGATPEGDRALLEAGERLTDAFSVELSQLQLQGDRITDSMLSATALLGVPAFANARVVSVTAASTQQNPTQEGITMTEEQRARLAELLGMNQRTPEQETEFQQLQLLAAQTVAQAPPADQPAPPAQAAAGATPELVAGVVAQLQAGGQLAALPAGLNAGGAGGGEQQRPLSDLYAAMTRVARGESRPGLEAALTSITQGSNAFTTQDQYAGQLWQALNYNRRFINMLTTGELRSYKGNGWKWGVAPAVAAYAGDKAAVPSNAPTTVNVPWTAQRLAGAHDLDRKFRDFGDDDFFQAYYEAMTLSYAMLSDQAARDFVIASATAGAAVTGGLLVSIAKLAARLNAAINDAGVDYVLVNDQDKIGLLSVSASSVPAFLEDFVGIKPGQFIGTPAVAAGTAIVGNKNAGQFLELPGSPIRAEVVDMVNGGIDGGVFGYYATVLNMPTAIQKAAWT